MKKGALEVAQLKQLCPMPMLLKRIGLGQFAKASCPSPFRENRKVSWCSCTTSVGRKKGL